MLKNQSNAALQTHYWFLEASASACVISEKQLNGLTRIQKALRFIENCPCKIKRIKIEGFV